MITDVSRRDRAEANTPDAGDQFTAVFRSNPAALVISRLSDGRYLDVNTSFETLLGWKRDEIVGHMPYEFDVYASVAEREVLLEQLRAKGSIRNFEIPMRAKSGELRDMVAGMEVIDFGGEPSLLSALTDVTEHRSAQRTLRRRERELAFLAEASAILASSLNYEQTLRTLADLVVPRLADWCAIHILDETGAVRELAVAHTDPAKVELARELQRRYPPDADSQSAVLQVARTGTPLVFPEITEAILIASAKDDDHLALMRRLGLKSLVIVPLIARGSPLGTITLVGAESGQRADEHDIALAQDLAQRAAIAVDNARLFTERGVAEEAVRTLNGELEQRVQDRTIQLAAANAELEAFAYSVSHDLRAPLRSMDGFSQILSERYSESLDERGLRYLGHIRDASQEMGQLIDALLRLARITRSEMQSRPVNLSTLVQTITERLTRQDPERDVRVLIPEQMVAIGDAQLLAVLFENLVGNAWKFTRKRSPALIEVGVDCGNGESIYFVRDNGAGFDQRYVGKLFGPFQRLHSVTEFEGTGVGLATVQRIVHRHGGRVWAEGKPEEGASFFFTLAPYAGAEV